MYNFCPVNWVFFPGGIVVKNLLVEARDTGFCPWVRKFPGVGDVNLLQYFCLGNSVDRRTWQATVHEVIDCSVTEPVPTTLF